jgi:DNA polymerase-3 subunit delta
LLTRALQRHGARRLETLLRDAQLADEQIKGQAPGEVWLTLASLALVLAGKRLALGKPLP